MKHSACWFLYLAIMSAKINYTIPPSAFEQVRDRIGAILFVEYAQQQQLDPTLEEVKVWCERFIPFDKTEIASINVMLSSGSYSNQQQGHSDGTYTYFIDCHAKAAHTDDDTADAVAMQKLHRMLRICRAVLEDSQYKTLDFAPPFVMNRSITNLTIGKPNNQDGAHNVMGRLTLTVRAPETVQLITPIPLGGIDAFVQLAESDKGYFFTYNTPSP